jgi:hypothetical protein
MSGSSLRIPPRSKYLGTGEFAHGRADTRDTLPAELRPSLLNLLLGTLSSALSPLNPHSYQPANGVVTRKIFGSVGHRGLA